MSTKRRKRHNPEQIVRKLRDADAMLNAGKDQASVLQSLEVSESTYLRCGTNTGDEGTLGAFHAPQVMPEIDEGMREEYLPKNAWHAACDERIH